MTTKTKTESGAVKVARHMKPFPGKIWIENAPSYHLDIPNNKQRGQKEIKQKMQKKITASGWLVAVRHPRPPSGFTKNEIFCFSYKRAAIGFIREVTSLGGECALANAKNK